ncbi:MAG: protein-export chaperone SecB [Succinatimonas sp.]|nr:protein-export chaperone SecB [Succinatimonas sp.]
MADNDQKSEVTNSNTQPQQAPQPEFEILRVYAKDCSLETPNTPAIFREPWKPQINVEFDAKPQSVDTDQFEIDLRVTVTCKVGEKTAFIAEVHQGGLFLVRNVSDEAAHYLLGAVAPNILFPYAREHIASMVNRATFPALNLRPLNFEAIYRARQAEAMAKAAAAKKEEAKA